MSVAAIVLATLLTEAFVVAICWMPIYRDNAWEVVAVLLWLASAAGAAWWWTANLS
jgi:hypothetical protein